jgi:hypothetical protein
MAVSAAYTFSLAHPEHEVMKNNIQFYRGLPDFNESDLINLESKPFKVCVYVFFKKIVVLSVFSSLSKSNAQYLGKYSNMS